MNDELNSVMTDDVNEILIENDYNYLLDRFAGEAVTGLLAYGNVPSYDLAHQAYQMATYMLAVKKGYVYGVSNMGNNP
jgi:hypothetical protein